MSKVLPDSWKILRFSERLDFGKTALAYFLSSLLDLGLISLTVPFVKALNGDNRPNSILLQVFRLFLAETFYMQNTATAISLLFIGVLCTRFLLRVIASELEKRFKNSVTAQLTSSLYETYITDEFEFHKKNESTHLINNIHYMREISAFIYEPWLKIYYEITSTFLVILYLVVLSPITSLIGALVIGLLLVIYQSITKKKISKLTKSILKSDRASLKIINDSLLLLPEIKIFHKEKFFERTFNQAIQRGIASRNQAHQLHAMAPTTMEFLGLLTSLTLILFVLQSNKNDEQLIPIISSFMIALFRLIPSAANIQSAMHRITYGKRQVEDSISRILNHENNTANVNLPIERDSTWTHITFDNVRFWYAGKYEESINCPHLKIERGSFTGVVGSSGAGKSTFVQLLSGLLKPNSGQINFWDSQFNQIDLSQITVGYVPQEVHLLNASLSANVGFGLGEEEIDYDRVANCLRDVQLDYLQNRFDLRNNQPMGEDGSSISGGERQRIGLARALYLNPSLLILDEVTSSLDSTNEALILDLISKLSRDLTTIFVSHHIEAIKRCDHLVKIENGHVSFKARI